MDDIYTEKIKNSYPFLVKEIEEIFDSRLKESETVEFKKSVSELDSALKTICAFLNNDGGSIYFGIKNNGTVIGSDISDANLREISQKIMQKIKPETIPHILIQKINGVPVLKITVEKGMQDIYYYNGVAYTRSGTSTVILPPDEIRKMILQAESMNWDSKICKEAKFSDLNISTVKKFINMAVRAKRIPDVSKNPETVLRKLELINDNGITNAAIILFGKESSRFFSNTLLRCGRFKDKLKKFFIDIKDYGENIFENSEKGLGFLQEHMKIVAKIEGLFRVEKWEIPIPALREAIINAMIHTDYTLSGFIYIAVYDDSVRISNPAYLMKGIDIPSLYKEHDSVIRNRLIANTIYLSGMIDRWGRGTLNIIDQLKDEDLELPEFFMNTIYFNVSFKRQFTPSITPPITPSINEKVAITELELKIFNLIKANQKITRKQIAEELGIGFYTVKEYVNKLKKKGFISRIGTKNGYWLLKE